MPCGVPSRCRSGRCQALLLPLYVAIHAPDRGAACRQPAGGSWPASCAGGPPGQLLRRRDASARRQLDQVHSGLIEVALGRFGQARNRTRRAVARRRDPHRRGGGQAVEQRPPWRAGSATRAGPARPDSRTRAPGGGPKPLATTDPGLLDAPDTLVGPDTRDDPCSPLRWTTKGLRQLADTLTQAGHPVSPTTVGRLLHAQGSSLQRIRTALEGAQHPDASRPRCPIRLPQRPCLSSHRGRCHPAALSMRKLPWSTDDGGGLGGGCRPG